MTRFESLLRIGAGFALLGIVGVMWMLCALLVFPSQRGRARVSNAFGNVLGGMLLRLTKSRIDVENRERLKGPAIFVSNHTSMIDILIAAWLVPPLTIALGKREILRYPIVGALFLLSGSIPVDRERKRKEHSALHALARRLQDAGLGVFMWPEGTRSADATLGPFHMGFARLAQVTGLDVVPVVVHRAWEAWPRKTLQLNATHIEIEVLPAIPAAAFATEDGRLDDVVERVHREMQAAIDARASRTDVVTVPVTASAPPPVVELVAPVEPPLEHAPLAFARHAARAHPAPLQVRKTS